MRSLINSSERVITQQFVNDISYEIIASAIEVHKHVGPGLSEHYKGKNPGGTWKLDLLVNDLVIIELKATEVMIPVFKAQLLFYLKIANKLKGLLINFNSAIIKNNMILLVTEQFRNLPK